MLPRVPLSCVTAPADATVTDFKLPVPDADAAAHSARLATLIREQIEAGGGVVPLARFVELDPLEPGPG